MKKNHILIVMTLTMTLGYMPWYNFSAVLKYLSDEFHLSVSDTGWILAAFQAGYVIVVGVTGWLGDKISLKKIIFYATLITGTFSTFFIWGAQGKKSILVLRLITGLSAGAIYVPGMALLSRWFPPKERGGALGAYTAALVLSYAGTYFIAGRLAASYGWRTGILWTSLPALFAAILILIFVKDNPPYEQESASTTLSNADLPNAENKALLQAPPGGYKGPVILSVSYMGHMWELYAFWGWIGPFLVSAAITMGMTPDAAVRFGGSFAAVIILLGVPATWIWGIFADRKGRTPAIIIAGCFSVLAQFLLGYLYGQSLAIIIIVGAWIGFWVIADSAIYKAGLTEMVLPSIRSTSLGIQSVAGYSMTIISPIVFGKILEMSNGPVAPANAKIWGPAFLVLGLGGVVAPTVAILLRRQRQAKLMADGKM
jgi:MFS family permease